MNGQIANTLTNNKHYSFVNEINLSSNRPKDYTAILNGFTQVYNIFEGTVVYIGVYKGDGTIYVQVSNHELIRYLHLKNIQVYKGSHVDIGYYLGDIANKDGLGFEYCTQWKGNSIYPVRYNNKLYYKQNPIDILSGNYNPISQVDITNGCILPHQKATFTEDELKEWGPTTIDDTDVYIEGAIL